MRISQFNNKPMVTMTSQEINLTAKEYGVLEYLMRNKGKVLSKEQIEYAIIYAWKHCQITINY